MGKNKTTRTLFVKTFFEWLPLGFVATVIIFTCCLVLQQYIRQVANMPQLQLAQDKAAILSAADAVQITSPNVEINKSLQAFEIIYDGSGKVLSSNAVLNGASPVLPDGVLENINKVKTITWQPQKSVRIAAVIQPVDGSSNAKFILVGKNLAESERQISNVLELSSIGVVFILIMSFGLVLIKNFVVEKL